MLNDPNHPKASVFIDPKNMTHAYKKKVAPVIIWEERCLYTKHKEKHEVAP